MVEHYAMSYEERRRRHDQSDDDAIRVCRLCYRRAVGGSGMRSVYHERYATQPADTPPRHWRGEYASAILFTRIVALLNTRGHERYCCLHIG